MGWSGDNSKPASSTRFKNFKICSLRSVLGRSSGDGSRKSGGSDDDRSFSQTLCPLLYNVYSSSEAEDATSRKTAAGGVTEKMANKGETGEPPEYYHQVICMLAMHATQAHDCLMVYFAIVLGG